MKILLKKRLNSARLLFLLIGILILFLAGQSFYLIKETQSLSDQIGSLKSEIESSKKTWAEQEYLNNIFLESASDYYQEKEEPEPQSIASPNKAPLPAAAVSSSTESVQSSTPTPRSIDEIVQDTTQSCEEKGHVNPETGIWDDGYYQQEGKKKECTINFPPDAQYLAEADRDEYQRQLGAKFKINPKPLLMFFNTTYPQYRYVPQPVYTNYSSNNNWQYPIGP